MNNIDILAKIFISIGWILSLIWFLKERNSINRLFYRSLLIFMSMTVFILILNYFQDRFLSDTNIIVYLLVTAIQIIFGILIFINSIRLVVLLWRK